MRLYITNILALCLTLLSAATAEAAALERVPEDGSLTQALQRVSNRGTIEIAAGTYVAPANGFRIRNKSMTIRARNGETVVVDGQGISTLFLIENQGVGTGDTVAFEGITFRNGFSTSTIRAGGVTVDGAKATFASCVFNSNVASGTELRGGAMQARNGSIVRLVNSRFEGNTAGQWGAGIFAIEESTIHVLFSEFIGNRTDLPGHGPVPAGAAIYLLNATAHVRDSHFENNASGWLGGALYALGDFRNPLAVPAALITVDNSTFIGNRAFPDDCCTPPGPPVGGAIHVENQATAIVRGSRFIENESAWGGAMASYRATIEVYDSIFRGNHGMPYDGVPAAGGSFNITSAEFPEFQNNNGAVNRPPASLTINDSFIQGRFGDTGAAAQQGGCIFAAGDGNSLEGLFGMPQRGTAEDNRALVVLDNVVLADCDVESGPEGRGFGGAIMINLADLTVDDSIVQDSDAIGDLAVGGGILSLSDNVVRARGTAFARNTAERRGGAMHLEGGEVEIRDSFFLENDASPGIDEGITAAPASALSLSTTDTLDMTGVVEGSVFTANVGLPIFDIGNADGPTFNEVVYTDNRIHSTDFGDVVYRSPASGPFGISANQLNNLNVNGANGTVDKGSGNSRLTSAPREGRLVAAPSSIPSTGTPGGNPGGSFLGFAWSGSSSSINGVALPDNVGFQEADGPGTYSQRLSGTAFTTARVGEEDCSGAGTLCLNGERFFVEVDFRDFGANVGTAQAVPGLAGDAGLYFFFSEDNWELLVKVLDGCSITDHFWVFAAATTNVEYTLRVTDKLTGATKSYFNPLGNAAAAVTDTQALASCDAKAINGFELAEPIPPSIESRPALKQGGCVGSDTELCLNQDRFRLEVDWKNFAGETGVARVDPFRTDDSGLFFFFTEDNLEMLVKVLTGCPVNGHFWVFAAATTNVEYTLKVTDTETGAIQQYFNPLGNASQAITDTEAFAVCPQ